MKEIMTEQDSHKMTTLTDLLNLVLTPDYLSEQEQKLMLKLIDEQIIDIQAKYGVIQEDNGI